MPHTKNPPSEVVTCHIDEVFKYLAGDPDTKPGPVTDRPTWNPLPLAARERQNQRG